MWPQGVIVQGQITDICRGQPVQSVWKLFLVIYSRSFERHIAKSYIYPSLLESPTGLCFTDQFAFRPSGSTAAATISLLHRPTVLTVLSTNDYVRVIALDFSKAFDTIRHAMLMEKMANLHMPDHIYN